MRPRVAARLGYIALYVAVGASFPYLPVFYESRGLSVGALVAASGAVAMALVHGPLLLALAVIVTSLRRVVMRIDF